MPQKPDASPPAPSSSNDHPPTDIIAQPEQTMGFTHPSNDSTTNLKPPERPPPDPEAQGVKMDSSSRWSDAALHARGKASCSILPMSMQISQDAALSGKNDVKSRWRRAIFLANRLSNGRSVMISGPKYDLNDHHPKSEKAKILETQHWLELIDSKHRYGSNLKYYHRRWIEDDTKENFFQWLDHGGGKDLDLQQCPRERLESERIIYLSAEQRLNYLTKIDSQGRLRWARNNEFVDTTPNRWKDAGEGKGIIPTTGEEDDRHDPNARRRSSFDTSTSSLVSSSSSISSRAKHHYSGKDADKGKLRQFFEKHFTVKGVTEKMLRKTLRKNTWIYVCDVDYNMFVGIKQTGTFQHSSFFGGSVSSAGLLTVKEGLVTSLSPLSGHYRTDIPYFEAFVKALHERGLDLHKIHITKEEAILWGISHWGKFNKKKGTFVKTRAEKVKAEVKKVEQVVKGNSLRSEKNETKKGEEAKAVALETNNRQTQPPQLTA
ncbi:hypothetical protein FS837_004063 [Tulasnella sp. UAMH 9824]|nr:hypothetical protein FS837_004063 [Tulasnella sp. UAMH 9824]